MEKKDMVNRVRNLAKCRSQTALEQRENQENTIKKQVLQGILRSIRLR